MRGSDQARSSQWLLYFDSCILSGLRPAFDVSLTPLFDIISCCLQNEDISIAQLLPLYKIFVKSYKMPAETVGKVSLVFFAALSTPWWLG